MDEDINWGKLYKEGRVKYPGIPWTNKERKAIYELKVPVEYVRQGALTIEDYNNMRKAESKSIEDFPIDKKRELLFKEAKKLKIDFKPTITDADLITLIQNKKQKLLEIDKKTSKPKKDKKTKK